MIKRGYLRYIYIFIAISFVVNILYISSPNESVFAKKDKDADNEKDKDQLVVNARINLNNIDMKNTEFIWVTAFINGEDFNKIFLFHL